MEEEKQKSKEHKVKEVREESSVSSDMVSKRSPWMFVSIVLVVVVVVLGIMMYRGVGLPGVTGASVIKGDQAGTKLVDFLNLRTGGGVSYVSNQDMGNLYQVTVSYQGQQVPVFVTKDGKYFVQGAIPMDATANVDNTNSNTQQEPPKDIPKSDKPKVELFVMTHCPYGTQAEKGIIPAMNALGNKVDFKIRFVHYFMHGAKEENETYNQVCIREEQGAKYMTYLTCFLEDGNTDRCLTKALIDKTKLNTCVTNKAKDYYKADSDLSQQYGVQGSPTLIVNGAEASSARDSQSYLNTICSSFNTAPSQCSQKLSTASPGPGFGTAAASSGSATSDAAQCG